jgi:type II secretory pathway component PulL
MSDAERLPAPKAPARWTLCCEADRRVVRTETGEAFALSPDVFIDAWRSAGEPALMQAGPFWDPDLVAPESVADLLDPIPESAIDLRQDPYRASAALPVVALRRAAMIALIAGVGHAGLIVADTVLMQRALQAERARAEGILARIAPQLPLEDDPAAQLDRLFPAEVRRSDPGPFLPDLARVASIAQREAEPVGFLRIGFDATDATLQVDVEAASLQALDRFQRALTVDGLSVTSTGAEQGDGGARASLVVVSGVVSGKEAGP